MSIGKRLIIIFLSSFFGITMAPDILVGADSVEIKNVNYSFNFTEKKPATTAVATTVTPVQSTPVQSTPVQSTPAKTTPVASTPVATTPATTPVQPKPVVKTNSITITGRTISVTNVNDTRIGAGDHVNFYRNKFLYGHNSSAVFGGLKNLVIGSNFSLTIDGVTTNYRVARVMVFDYEETTNGNGAIRFNNDGRNYILNVVRAKDNNDTQYNLSIMTCHGKSLGNNNATQRLVLFANKI